ncbi:hypothetical protein [Gymnodinialimonas phycosphaerae]|uniref:hypothetical protein n=1 Tax=Gymnodinialimonas phycosphaerae TaxID=2841589 RepID=UPI001F162449
MAHVLIAGRTAVRLTGPGLWATAAIGCGAALGLSAPAGAFVLGGEILQQTGNGSFVKLGTDAPFAVGADTFDTDDLYAFDEDQNILLVEPIRVDIGGGDLGAIPAGTVVASHYVFFDSLNGTQYGYVDFDAPILGIAAQQETMAATDFLANTAVTYLSLELRGLERGDQVWIDADDPFRLWVYWAGSSPGDYIRVFTARSAAAMM